jgi:hypothetical protein
MLKIRSMQQPVPDSPASFSHIFLNYVIRLQGSWKNVKRKLFQIFLNELTTDKIQIYRIVGHISRICNCTTHQRTTKQKCDEHEQNNEKH